jgi:hypothetical protein
VADLPDCGIAQFASGNSRTGHKRKNHPKLQMLAQNPTFPDDGGTEIKIAHVHPSKQEARWADRPLLPVAWTIADGFSAWFSSIKRNLYCLDLVFILASLKGRCGWRRQNPSPFTPSGLSPTPTHPLARRPTIR